MIHNGPTFYDDDAIFDTYMARRSRSDNPNDTLEKPVILELVGELTNQRILDLGCGDATFGREALTQGCQSYLGVEGVGFVVESVRESEPHREWFEDDETCQRRQRIPLFLIMAGKKSVSQKCA